jgi:hypothetical protein
MERVEMKNSIGDQRKHRALAVIVLSLVVAVGAALADQDRYTLTAPNGIAFSEFKGYDHWEDVSVSTTDTGIKAILGNPAMIEAYKEGIPENGKTFPDGAAIVKIEWNKAPNPVSPYSVQVPTTLKSISFIEKDSKRFSDTSGWGYAQFLYDPATRTFKPYGADSSFGKNVCYKCHTKVAERDYIFTGYPPR